MAHGLAAAERSQPTEQLPSIQQTWQPLGAATADLSELSRSSRGGLWWAPTALNSWHDQAAPNPHSLSSGAVLMPSLSPCPAAYPTLLARLGCLSKPKVPAGQRYMRSVQRQVLVWRCFHSSGLRRALLCDPSVGFCAPLNSDRNQFVQPEIDYETLSLSVL